MTLVFKTVLVSQICVTKCCDPEPEPVAGTGAGQDWTGFTTLLISLLFQKERSIKMFHAPLCALSECEKDLKIVTRNGVLWMPKLVLASVSSFVSLLLLGKVH